MLARTDDSQNICLPERVSIFYKYISRTGERKTIQMYRTVKIWWHATEFLLSVPQRAGGGRWGREVEPRLGVGLGLSLVPSGLISLGLEPTALFRPETGSPVLPTNRHLMECARNTLNKNDFKWG